MNSNKWENFKKAREHFRQECKLLERFAPELEKIQQEFAGKVEKSIVYNTALEEDVKKESEIKLILVGDNPGRNEQKVGRYLVGSAGKFAQTFFATAKKEFEINNFSEDYFKENVIILNKTPIYSPRTRDLYKLRKKLHEMSGPIADVLEKSQKMMAKILFEFYEALNVPVWIIGYPGMRDGDIFDTYIAELKNKKMRERIYFYHHFSFNRFTIDLKKQQKEQQIDLWQLGEKYREDILGEIK